MQAGRGVTAEGWLAAAQQHASTDVQFAAILGVRGMNASDRGVYAVAFAHLAESVDRARVAGDARQEAWSLSLLARAHLLRGELGAAEPVLDRSLQLVHEQRWIAFQPWPQVLRAELDLAHGDLVRAGDALEHAWELARQVDDPCWEGMAARGLGLLATRRHRPDRASKWMQQAATRCKADAVLPGPVVPLRASGREPLEDPRQHGFVDARVSSAISTTTWDSVAVTVALTYRVAWRTALSTTAITARRSSASVPRTVACAACRAR